MLFVGQRRNEPREDISKYGMFVSKSSEPKSTYHHTSKHQPNDKTTKIILTH